MTDNLFDKTQPEVVRHGPGFTGAPSGNRSVIVVRHPEGGTAILDPAETSAESRLCTQVLKLARSHFLGRLVISIPVFR